MIVPELDDTLFTPEADAYTSLQSTPQFTSTLVIERSQNELNQNPGPSREVLNAHECTENGTTNEMMNVREINK